MADPLSVAGLAAGVISLGLQVCGGITSYVEALECREQDIASARQQNRVLRRTLQVIQTCLVQLQDDGMHQAAAAAVRDCVHSCTQELNALSALVGELTGHSQSITGQGNRIKAQGRKLLYPFSRPKLVLLETRLRNANAALQLTLQTLGLSLSQQGAGKLTALESAVHDLAVNQRAIIQSEVSAMTSPLQDIHGTLRGLNDNLEQLVKQLVSPGPDVDGKSAEVTPEAVAGRLLAKPAALRAVCDSFGSGTQPESSAAASARTRSGSAAQPEIRSTGIRGTSLCSCRSRRNPSRRNVILGPLTFFLETANSLHLPGCPAADSADPVRKAGLKYTGLRRLLNLVVQVSFTMTSNAGGCSIGSNVTYYPTVDRETAPAFRIIGLLYQAYLSSDYGRVTPSHHAELVSYAQSMILRLFQTGKASPRAVDSKNQSLIHRLADLMRFEHHSWRYMGDVDGHSAASLQELLKLLIVCKAPADDYDTSGDSPLSLLFPDHDDYDDSTPNNALFAAAQLILESGEGTLASISPPSLRKWVFEDAYSDTRRCTAGDILDFLACSPKVAEAYGCGPLSLAIIANDLDAVEHLLRNHKATLKERNLFGQSPLHLAVRSPACLRLLEPAARADSALLNDTDCRNMSAFEVALAISGARCRIRRSRGHQCGCADSPAAILLEADCALPVTSYLQVLLWGASPCCTELYIRRLVDRRRRLKRLAIRNLSVPEAEELGLFRSAVLDYHAPRVCQLLQKRGVQIPDALRVQRKGSPPIASVYQVLEEASHADLFYQAEFLDTDSVLKPGGSKDGVSPGLVGKRLFVQWLAEHGVDVVHAKLRSFPSSEGRALFTAHYTFFSIAHHFPAWRHQGFRGNDLLKWFPPSKRVWIDNITTATLKVNNDMTDACRCQCTPKKGGCTPLTYLFKGILDTFWSNKPSAVQHAAVQFARYLCLFGAEHLRQEHHAAAIRYFTFTVLQLPHTCCKPETALGETCAATAWSDEDVEAVEEEHEHGLALLEELVDEFEGEVAAILDNNHDSEDVDQVSRLMGFWMETWATRMLEVLDGLGGCRFREDEKRGAEEIGVMWYEPPEVEVEGRYNPHCESSVEYWMYELRIIGEECGLVEG